VHRILLVEDDPTIAEPLVRSLHRDGYEVHSTASGRDASEIGPADVDLILLDLTLADLDGLEVCRRLRNRAPALPIIVLTARAEEMEVLAGFDAGADDYVTKPFRYAELSARIRARLRLSGPLERLDARGVCVDLASHRVFRDGVEIDVTLKEFELLVLLLREAGRVVPRSRIMREVWDDRSNGASRTLDMHVSSLRRKLGDEAGHPSLITTVRGVGFRFETN